MMAQGAPQTKNNIRRKVARKDQGMEKEKTKNTEEMVKELMAAADKNGIAQALRAVFGRNVKVSIPFSRGACDMSIDEVDFSPRANNSLKRGGVFRVGEIIDLISDDGLLNIRNLGKKTQNEIKTRILTLGYERLSENEKKRFFYEVLQRNGGL